jgi:hypothetical protein
VIFTFHEAWMINTMQLARQGSYGKALTMLLEPDVWRGLSLHDYVSWAHEIWHILALRATRRYVILCATLSPRSIQISVARIVFSMNSSFLGDLPDNIILENTFMMRSR